MSTTITEEKKETNFYLEEELLKESEESGYFADFYGERYHFAIIDYDTVCFHHQPLSQEECAKVWATHTQMLQDYERENDWDDTPWTVGCSFNVNGHKYSSAWAGVAVNNGRLVMTNTTYDNCCEYKQNFIRMIADMNRLEKKKMNAQIEQLKKEQEEDLRPTEESKQFYTLFSAYWLRHRTINRELRGVEGTSIK